MTWRALWAALASWEMQLGLNITVPQVSELFNNISNINYERAEELEKELRHDVMAHVHAYAEQCPNAAPIIHLGATSAYVVDNTDIILMRDAYEMIESKILRVLAKLEGFIQETKELPCLSYTHLQPAQPTTMGRRACLWAQDLLIDLDNLRHKLKNLRFLGAKGATGTQASFKELLGDKVEELDEGLAKDFGFKKSYIVSGQTPPRKVDAQALDVLSGIAQTAHKFANDIRLLMSTRCVQEPWGKKQIGSSAMPYKMNPMKCERITSLSRLVISLSSAAAQTAAEQWFERTLDDSAGKRIIIPEAFMAIDAILDLYETVISGITVNKSAISKELSRYLPFMATENILMEAVARGGDRQKLHEKLRQYSYEELQTVDQSGINNLLYRLKKDPDFEFIELSKFENAKHFIGRSVEQVNNFISKELDPVLQI